MSVCLSLSLSLSLCVCVCVVALCRGDRVSVLDFVPAALTDTGDAIAADTSEALELVSDGCGLLRYNLLEPKLYIIIRVGCM